jgi:myosin heavy subunit
MAPTKSKEDAEAIDDLCSLESCTDQTVLEHLELRWRHCLPYTQLGGIVVAVNPHKWLDIYSDGENKHLSTQHANVHSTIVSTCLFTVLVRFGGERNANMMVTCIACVCATERAYVEGQSKPAHIFKTSATAYRALLDKQRARDQTIMISGVAGSGKTETAKLIQVRALGKSCS